MQCAVCSVQFAVFSVKQTVCDEQCAVRSVQCAVSSFQYSVCKNCIQCSVFSAKSETMKHYQKDHIINKIYI